MTLTAERYIPLDDIAVRSEGGQRIIDAYAAAFGVRQEIRDREGHYFEELAGTSFDRTIAQRSGRFQVIFNHGKTLYGTPAERFSMPYGTALDVKADARGVFTSTQVANTPLGDEILELVESGAIKGQSFSGEWKSTKPGAAERGGLPVKIRTEVMMREYGLTPFPHYEAAHVVGVRADLADLATEDLVEHLLGLPEGERSDLLTALTAATATGTSTDQAPGSPDAPVAPATRGVLLAQLRQLDLECIR